jgi:hypothetical protein
MMPSAMSDEYDVEFRWKEQVIYWEATRGVVFQGGWGVEPPVTIVPDSTTWDRKAPAWLRGRHDEVVARLRAEPGHVVHEERDDSKVVPPLREVTRDA